MPNLEQRATRPAREPFEKLIRGARQLDALFSAARERRSSGESPQSAHFDNNLGDTRPPDYDPPR